MFLAVVPACNEEQSVGNVVRELLSVVDQVVVIDDGSTDATAQKARDAGAVVLQHRVNRGQGAALETGHEYARRNGADIVLHFDADGQFSITDIAPAKEALLHSQADVLFGSRFLADTSAMPWFKRMILFPIAAWINRTCFGIDLKDTHNGFRLLTKNALQVIRITQDKMAHATEIPVLAKKAGLTYIEFPVTVTYHEYGQGLLDGVDVVTDLVTGTFIQKK